MTVNFTPAARRATDAALAFAAKSDRVPLRALHVKDGRAFVTDSYVAVELYWIEGLPDGSWDVDPLREALKGAGAKVYARMDVNEDGALVVERVEPGNLARSFMEGGWDGSDLPAHIMRGAFIAPAVQIAGRPLKVLDVMDSAYAVANGEREPEPGIPLFGPDLLSDLLKCHPDRYDRVNVTFSITYDGPSKPFTVCNGRPFAIQMPMRAPA